MGDLRGGAPRKDLSHVATLITRVSLVASALLGCGPSGATATGTEASSSPSTTGSGTTGPTETGSLSSDSLADTSSTGPGTSESSPGGSCQAPTDPRPGAMCSTWNDDCPEGQKCLSVNEDEAACVDLVTEPASVGAACQGEKLDDPCVRGAYCFLGVCHAYCECSEADPSCADPCATCAFFNGGQPPVCGIPCDPLSSSCEGDLSCKEFGTGRFVCTTDVYKGQLGDACLSGQFCAQGFTCVDSDAVPGCTHEACCSPLCEVGGSSTCVDMLGTDSRCVPFDNPTGCPDFGIGVCVSGS